MPIPVPDVPPLDNKQQELVEGFRKCITGQIIDATEMLGLSDRERAVTVGLSAVDPTLPTMAGIAVTTREGPRRLGTSGYLMTQHADVMRKVGPGHVLVIDAGGSLASCNWGVESQLS